MSPSVTVKIVGLPFISDDVLFLSIQIATIFPIKFFTGRKFRNDVNYTAANVKEK